MTTIPADELPLSSLSAVSDTTLEAAEKLKFEQVREGHEFIRAAKSLKLIPRFSA
jgi:hypothetical protein